MFEEQVHLGFQGHPGVEALPQQGDVAGNGGIEHDEIGFKQVFFPVLSQYPPDVEAVEGGDLLLQLVG